MDDWFDFFLELFFQVFGRGVFSLYSSLIPQNAMSRRKRKVLKVAIGIVNFVVLSALLVGIFLLLESGVTNAWGWGLLVFGLFYIISGVVLEIRKQ